MAKFRAWLKKHLRSKPSSKNQPPFLPSPRRPLTPASFDTPACLFFQLPYEIRSMIFSMAFGNRSVHMDIVRQNDGAWQWRGMVCYQKGCWTKFDLWRWLGPWADPCLRDTFEYGKEFPQVLNIGIMGFLLSCKQAYTEGIDVLYATNPIRIQSEPLLLHLPRLIPSNRLANITSIEIVVDTHITNSFRDYNVDHLKPILDNIATHCHRLRTLCISLALYSRTQHWILDGPALPMVDAFFQSKPLRKMRVELPFHAYSVAHKGQPHTPDHPREAPVEGPLKRSKWRCLDGEQPVIQWRSLERYPLPPLRLPDDSEESKGYWLAEGDSGPHDFSCSM